MSYRAKITGTTRPTKRRSNDASTAQYASVWLEPCLLKIALEPTKRKPAKAGHCGPKTKMVMPDDLILAIREDAEQRGLSLQDIMGKYKLGYSRARAIVSYEVRSRLIPKAKP